MAFGEPEVAAPMRIWQTSWTVKKSQHINYFCTHLWQKDGGCRWSKRTPYLLLDTQMKCQTILCCVAATVTYEPLRFSSLSDRTLLPLPSTILTLFFFFKLLFNSTICIYQHLPVPLSLKHEIPSHKRRDTRELVNITLILLPSYHQFHNLIMWNQRCCTV